jgi:hypothetical protein
MNRICRALVGVALSALVVPNAFAASGLNTGRVTTLLWYEGHDGLLVRQIGMTDLGGCGRSDYFILDSQHVHFREIYAMLLSAHLSDLPVQISIDSCVQGISRITHVQISH